MPTIYTPIHQTSNIPTSNCFPGDMYRCHKKIQLNFPLYPESSHPQTQLPTRCSRRYPVIARMKLRHRRYCRYPFPTQLRQLLAFGRVDIDEAVHVADAQALDGVWGVELPLGAKAVFGWGMLVREGFRGGFGEWEVNVWGDKWRLHSDPATGLVVVFNDC